MMKYVTVIAVVLVMICAVHSWAAGGGPLLTCAQLLHQTNVEAQVVDRCQPSARGITHGKEVVQVSGGVS